MNYKMILLSLIMVLALPLSVCAGTAVNPYASLSSTSKVLAATHVVAGAYFTGILNNLDGDNIADSAVDWPEIAAQAINATHIAYRNVRSQHIDTGAIRYDTQLAPQLIENLTTLIGTASDTTVAWQKSLWGFYQGDGTDTRWISSTNSTFADSDGGAQIKFTITAVTIYMDSSVTTQYETVFTDQTHDNGFYVQGDQVYHYNSSSLWWCGYGAGGTNLPAFNNDDSDSTYFIVGGVSGTQKVNVNDNKYIFRVDGY